MKHLVLIAVLIILTTSAKAATPHRCHSDIEILADKNIRLSSLGIKLKRREVRRGPYSVLLESGGEIETPIEHIVAATQTTDGTIRPVMAGFPFPTWFRTKYESQNRSITETEWKSVLPFDRSRLLKEVLENELTRRDRINNIEPWKVPGLLLERSRDPGDISHYFLPEIEFVEGPKPTIIEIKFRSPLLPSETRKVLMARFPDAPSLHVHAVAPLGMEKLRARPKREAARIIDRMLRFNLMAEMMSIVHKGYPITGSHEHYLSGTFHSTKVEDAVKHVSNLAFTGRVEFELDLKLGLVGQRSDEDYDHKGVRLMPGETPHPGSVFLLGSESRFLRRGKAGIYGEFKRRDLRLVDAFLDKTQELVASDFDDPGSAALDLWLQAISPGQAPNGPTGDRYQLRAFREAWYNDTVGELFKRLPKSVEAYLTSRESEGPTALERFRHLAQRGPIPRHEELKMLLHNWATFPLIYGEPLLQAKIERAQIKGIQSVMAGEEPGPIVTQFLIESGLYRAVAKSLGLQKYLPWGIRFRR